MKYKLTGALIGIVVSQILFAFVMWGYSPSEYEGYTRLMMVNAATLLGGAGFAIGYTVDEDE